MALGDDLVVGVDDLELDVFVDDLVVPTVAADFLVALAAIVVLPADPDVFATVLVGPEEEYLDGELELAVRLLTTEGFDGFVDEG